MPMPGALTAEQAAVLAQASAALQQGDAEAAVRQMEPLLKAGSRNADLLLTYSVACQQAGYRNPAEGSARVGVQEAPERADLWAQLGIVLDQSGRSQEAVEMFERAALLEPGKPAHLFNLGVAALSAKSPNRAVEALARLAEIDPSNAAGWGLLGVAQQLVGDLPASEASLREALRLETHQPGVIHNLALTLRMLGRPAEALLVLNDAAITKALLPQSMILRADLLGDVGDYEKAAEAYKAVVREDPRAIDAHEELARLLPQLDRASEQLDAYRDALRRAPTLELYSSALRAAWDLREPAALRDWSSEALRRFGNLPGLLLMQALGYRLAGEPGKAVELLEQLVAAGFAPALVPAAHDRLKLGDVRRAETLAMLATRANAGDQAAWAYLTIVWRLLEDEREAWLADYSKLVMPVQLEPPPGFGSIQSFMSALADDLHALHVTKRHPTDQSLRQGTQTRGRLFDQRDGLVGQLARIVEQAIGRLLAELPSDPAHPFLGRNTGRTSYLGSWSVRLAKGGYHLTHIHSRGWLSSALYVALPAEITARPRERNVPGSLTFGVPERELGLELAPRRTEVPQIGRLVLFPSYFWHGTTPFESEDYRLTVAFDASPA